MTLDFSISKLERRKKKLRNVIVKHNIQPNYQKYMTIEELYFHTCINIYFSPASFKNLMLVLREYTKQESKIMLGQCPNLRLKK